jgi:hypothetical protein
LRLNGVPLAEVNFAQPNEHSDITGTRGLHLQVAHLGAAKPAAALEAELEFRFFKAALKSIAGNTECSGNLSNVIEAGGQFLDVSRGDFNPALDLPSYLFRAAFLPHLPYF